MKKCRCIKPSHWYHIDETGPHGGSFLFVVGEEYEFTIINEKWGETYEVKNGDFKVGFPSKPWEISKGLSVGGNGRTFFENFEILN